MILVGKSASASRGSAEDSSTSVVPNEVIFSSFEILCDSFLGEQDHVFQYKPILVLNLYIP